MGKPTGFFFPITDQSQMIVKAIAYSCLSCNTTYRYVKQVDRCVNCGAPIDLEGLRELGRKYNF